MLEDMPQRPANHARGTWAVRTFESLIPAAWVSSTPEEDYGVDKRVEIFEDGRATGLEFNVQIKGTVSGNGEKPGRPVERTTLAYWKALASPTLVVVGHETTERVWYTWSHLLDWEDDRTSKKRLVRGQTELTKDSSRALVEEVKAYRMARHLGDFLPVSIAVTGDLFHGESAAAIKVSIRQLLKRLPEYVRLVFTTPDLPYAVIDFRDDRVMVGIRGDANRQLTWGPVPAGFTPSIAADIVAALSLAFSQVGAHDLSARLLKLAIPDSGMLPQAYGIGIAIRELMRHGDSESVISLLRKTACIEGHPGTPMVLAAISIGSDDDSRSELTTSASWILADAARGWSKPAQGLYNAAGLVATSDFRKGLALYEEAAENDPGYRSRDYWWLEVGRTQWRGDLRADAQDSYEQAVALGSTKARALLGDAQMRRGQYAAALATFTSADIWAKPSDAQWRLSTHALTYIVDELGIDAQDRDEITPPDFEPTPGPDLKERALLAIKTDALNAWAHAAVAAGEPEDVWNTAAAITAAVTVNTLPFFWTAMINSVMQDPEIDRESRTGLLHDALHCVWIYFGEDFKDFVLSDEQIRDEIRSSMLDAFEAVRPERTPFEIRQHDGEGYESHFI